MARSGDGQPANGEAHDHAYTVSGDALNRIVVPLTVVHARVQLLRRRIHRNEAIENDDIDRVLAHMEEATRAIAAALWEIMGTTTRSRDADPD